MKTRKLIFQDGSGGSALAIRMPPLSRKNEVTKFHSDGTVNVKFTAPPINGKAKIVLKIFLTEKLEVKQSEIEIIAGKKGRNKIVSIYGLDSDTVNRRISGLISNQSIFGNYPKPN
ncbi:MAG: DUF167 domain-containing protein [Anaerolineales bacterium]|nr:DUF167 domain-containing protein [Anaerolineales bacterium]